MPANARSLTLTDAYRSRLLALGDRVDAQARQRWPQIENFDATDWPEAMAGVISRAQVEGVRLSAGYLTSFLRSETGRGTAPAIDSRAYAGQSRDGRPLADALLSPLIGVRVALKEGKAPEEALRVGLERGLPNINLDVLHAARRSLNDAMEAEPRIEGWQRGVKGTCGACMGDIAVEVRVQLPSLPLLVHPNCQCVTVPVVSGLPQRFQPLTGAKMFETMTRVKQDAQFGVEKAALLRAGHLELEDLVQRSPQATADDFITEAPAWSIETLRSAPRFRGIERGRETQGSVSGYQAFRGRQSLGTFKTKKLAEERIARDRADKLSR